MENGSPAERKAGLNLAVARGWLVLHDPSSALPRPANRSRKEREREYYFFMVPPGLVASPFFSAEPAVSAPWVLASFADGIELVELRRAHWEPVPWGLADRPAARFPRDPSSDLSPLCQELEPPPPYKWPCRTYSIPGSAS